MQNNNAKFGLNLKQRSYFFALDIIKLIESLPHNNLSNQVISKQLIRSATSIGANIIEAQAGSSRKDFTNFFNYALKSANESKFWLELLRDSQKTNENKISILIQEVTELSKILGSSIVTLKNKAK